MRKGKEMKGKKTEMEIGNRKVKGNRKGKKENILHHFHLFFVIQNPI